MQPQVSIPLRPASRVRATTQQSLTIARLFMLVIMALAVWLGLAPLTAVPNVVPATAPAAEFSAERAMQDLRFVAAEPRPIGSPRNAAVRDYLTSEITALGLEAEVQTTTQANFTINAGSGNVGVVHNVLTRLPGTDSSGAILISGHYDSVLTSTGGSDCGACTVTALEALRAIQAGPPLKNDVIFLFTDGEEIGVVGAAAFMEQHPWARDVAFSLVFEAIGTHGAAVQYTATPGQGAFVREALRAQNYPMASSFINDLMWNLARNTGSDLDAFSFGGRPGVAFIYLEGANSYHTMADSVERIDPRSIQHLGEHTVSLARHFGNLALDELAARPDEVYFPVLPFVVAHYSSTWALPLALLSLLAFALLFFFGLQRRRVNWRGMVLGVFAILFTLLLSVVVVTAVWWVLRYFNTNLHPFLIGGWYQGELYLAAFLTLTLAIAYPSLRWFATRAGIGKRENVTAMYSGVLLAWVLLGLLMVMALPGFSYLFAWPLLFALAGYAYLIFGREEERPLQTAVVLTLVAIPALLLFAPVLHFFSIYAARMEGLMGLPIAALPIPFAVFLLALLLPQLDYLAPFERRHQRWFPLTILAIAIVVLLTATLRSGFSAEQPKANTVVYRLNLSTAEAHWLTLNDSRAGRGTRAQLDEWTGQFFPNGGQVVSFNPWPTGWLAQEYPALQTAAPMLELPHTQVTVLEDRVEAGQRHLQWQMAVPPEVLELFFDVNFPGRVVVLKINGRPVDVGDLPLESFHLNLNGRAEEGYHFEMILEGNNPITLVMQDHLPTLPEVPGLDIRPRPEWMMPAPWQNVADSSLVTHTVVLD